MEVQQNQTDKSKEGKHPEEFTVKFFIAPGFWENFDTFKD